MKAAIITAPGKSPIFADFNEPAAYDGAEVIAVRASALSHFSKSRASGAHYSSDAIFPSVPGIDGVGLTLDGRRVYFVLPEAPYGALAEKSLVRARQCLPLPESLDDLTAAAIANPGMSAWAALVERAHLQPGENVLVNGATGSAGRLAVQLAKYLGAAKVIATGRNEAELEDLKSLGADVVIPFSLGAQHLADKNNYEEALIAEFAKGINVVIDYLWGESAKTIIAAITKAVEDATPVRFVHVGAASGQDNIELPSAVLRSSAIQLMGSGIKSVPLPRLFDAVRNAFDAIAPANLKIATEVRPLSDIEQAWSAPGKPRIVITMP